MKSKILNASLLVAVLVILAAFGRYVRVGATADCVAVLRTSGMTCGTCVDRITKALQSQRGVAATEVDLARGYVIAGYDSKQVSPGALAQKVAKSGFACDVETVVSPEEFSKITGRRVGQKVTGGSGCCGSKGCGEKNQ